jgi:glycosyltransferase involved in cell wall biosynthesis
MTRDLSLAIIIATYKRSHLLKLLVQDIAQQSRLPQRLVIIDGSPEDGQTLAMLQSFSLMFPITYIPSNHGNLPYQRYLGYLATRDAHDVVLYFDDDLRLPASDNVEKIVAPFSWADETITGVTALSNVPETTKSDIEKIRSESVATWITDWFGSAKREHAGGMTAVGNKIMPDDSLDYAPVQWLQGRVMAFRVRAMSDEAFPEDLFALAHVKSGLGEDTIISRNIGRHGKMLFAYCTAVDHPNDDIPRSYPDSAKRGGFAVAYSRRYINDMYRLDDPPTLRDRLELLKSYAGNVVLNWVKYLRRLDQIHSAYALGYMQGVLKGLITAPRSDQLTPEIEWRADAQQALADKIDLPAS